MRQRECFVNLGHFLPFSPTNILKNENFENMRRTSGDIIILQMCIINDNYIMYGSWNVECKGQNFLSFWTIFRPSTPLTTPKIIIFRKWKHTWRNYFTHVYNHTINDNHMMYGSGDMERDGQKFLSFWIIFFPFYTPNKPKKSKFWKNEKNHVKILSFYTCVP